MEPKFEHNLYKVPIKLCKPNEALDFSNVSGHRPVMDHFNLAGLHADPFETQYISKKLYDRLHEGTFFQFPIESMLADGFQYVAHMLSCMGLFLESITMSSRQSITQRFKMSDKHH